MVKPTKRKQPTTEKPSVTPPKKDPKKAGVYKPRRFKLDEDQVRTQNGSMPFHAMIGEDRLEPYVWINLKGDNEDLLFYLNLPHWEVSPLRKGLKKVVLKNEIGKYPTVEFEMYVPDYRDIKGSLIQDKISLFKMGANFSVKWGYRNAHTKWSNLVVYEHKIAFEEGTAVLKVKGKAGNRLSATNTNEVFTAEYGKSGIEQLASVVGMKVDHKELLEDELDQVRQAEDDMVTFGMNLGALLWRESTKHGIDFFVDPERGEIRLASPYKLDLIKRGAKAYRMTYGFPASPIASIEYTRKYPKKKRSRGYYRKGLSQKAKGGTGAISDDRRTLLKMIHGVFTSEDQNERTRSFTVGDPFRKANFPNIEEAQKAFPADKGYEVQRRNTSTHGLISPSSGEVFHIFKEVVVGDKTVTDQTQKISKNVFIELSARPNKVLKVIRVIDPEKIEVKIWTLSDMSPSEVEANQEQKEPENTTKETTPEMEWKVVEKVFVPQSAVTDMQAVGINTDHSFFKRSPDILERIKDMKEEARENSEKNRISIKEEGQNLYKITLTREAEKEKEVKKANQENQAEPPSQDGHARAESKPSGQGGGVSRGSSGKIVTSINVKTKVGDWTLRVGRLLEIVDLYSAVDGYYSISSEEHTIDTNGFHTKVEAKKATSKTVDRYGARSGGSPSSATRKKGEEKAKVEEKKTTFVEKVEQELFVKGTRSFRLFDPH